MPVRKLVQWKSSAKEPNPWDTYVLLPKKYPTMATHETAPRYQIGARVRVDKDVTTMPALPAYVGIVKEIIPSYVDKTIGYNLTLEEDPRPGRLWFFLQHQLTPA
jgi:hypothetical protein